MMPGTCPKCGLPEELCMCQAIAKEEQRIKVRISTRKWGREVTLIMGINPKEVDISSLTTKLKNKCACGGTAKDGIIELQGDHRHRIKDLLLKEGYDSSNIDIQ
ncbi:MAG: stress response translation initiation inhibitor YciH [Candidatus Heimdallarchaeota archaeon]|nr:stress response translation initiation inhibitor YciH [Candidatus Heimdallarchaeota archaeon]MBY8993096.1 stress response translation initiation inhibitor YciH [Candidatus Heimdallarchaeota archaeon]